MRRMALTVMWRFCEITGTLRATDMADLSSFKVPQATVLERGAIN